MVNSNEGITIGVPSQIIELYSNIRFIPLRERGATVNIELICQGYEKLSEPLKRFFDFMKEYSKNQ